MWNWLLDFPNLALIDPRLLSMHITACASERNCSKLDLMSAKYHAKLGILGVSQEIVFLEMHAFTDISEAELLDLSLKDDD